MLISQFNLSNPGKDMKKLLNDGNNLLMLVKSTDAITANSIIKQAKKRADKLTALTGKTVLPSITAQAEAQEEANQLNVINQLVIGAKKGLVKAITKLVGSVVTDAILRMANGSNHKSTAKFTLYKVMNLAIDGTNQPSMNNVLEQLLEVINHNFDFRKKVSIKMELMQLNVAQMAMYGINFGIPQLMLTLLANMETATKSNYGHEFAWPCMPYTRNTRTTTCMMQLCSRSFSRSWRVPTASGFSKTHRHQEQRPRIWLPNWSHTSKPLWVRTPSQHTPNWHMS